MFAQKTIFNVNATMFVPKRKEEEHEKVDKKKSKKPSWEDKKKTELCQNWVAGKTCKFAEKCTFAHGEKELARKTHVKKDYKKVLCEKYLVGYCKYGQRC